MREMASLVEELRQVVRRGLPLTPGGKWPRLAALASVRARAGTDTSPTARAEAVDWVLRRTLARMEPDGLRDAAKALFGLPPGPGPGANLTARRETAATAAGKEAHHFRKRIEPQLLTEFAHALVRDAAAQTRPWAAPPPVRPGRRRRVLPADVFAWEAHAHEEALTRLWAGVYALRAELLSAERNVSMGDAEEANAAADDALRAYGRLQDQARAYRAAYGAALLPDGAAAPHQLGELAGWVPELTVAEDTLLADAAAAPTPDLFLARLLALPGGPDLIARWRTELTEGDRA